MAMAAMTPAVIVQKAMWNEARGNGTNIEIPAPVMGIARGVHWVHKAWRTRNKIDNHTGPNSFWMIAGHGLNFIAGNNECVKFAAHCVLIANRVQGCVHYLFELHNACVNFGNAVCNKNARHRTHEWVVSKESSFFSPSTANSMRRTAYATYDYVVRLGKAIGRLAIAIFGLSMSILDAMDAFVPTREIQNEKVSEIFVNAAQNIDYLVSNQKQLLKLLRANRNVIKLVLTDVGSKYKVDEIIAMVESNLTTSKKVQNGKNMAGEVVKDFGKGMLFQAAAMVGQHTKLPQGLKPNAQPAWERNKSATLNSKLTRCMSKASQSRLLELRESKKEKELRSQTRIVKKLNAMYPSKLENRGFALTPQSSPKIAKAV